MMTKLSVIGVAVFAALPTAAAAATAPTCALAPSAAVEATLRQADLLPALFAALQEAGGCAVQDPARIEPELTAARSMGFDCAFDDTACLRKLAALLRVQRVIAAAAEPKDDSLQLALVVVDAKRGERLITAQGAIAAPGPARNSGLQELALRLLAPERVAVAQPSLQPLPAQPDAPDATAVATTQPEQPAPSVSTPKPVKPRRVASAQQSAGPVLAVVGWSIAGGGGGVALLGGLGALALDSTLLYSDAGDHDARSGMLLAERVLAGVAVVGLVAGGAGLGIALLAGGE